MDESVHDATSPDDGGRVEDASREEVVPRPAPGGGSAPAGDDVAELVRRAQRKDAAAFTALIRRFERVALSVAYATLGGSGNRSGDMGAVDAGDVVQEAFCRAWERLPELKEPARFGSWVCGVVRNLAIDARRRLRTQRVHVPRSTAGGGDAGDGDGLPDPHAAVADERADDPLDALHRQEQRGLLADAVASLDEVSRTAVVLRYYDNLSSKQIGELLDLNPTAVDMRLSRARQALRQKLSASAAFEA